MRQYTGTGVALVTPFKKDLSIDFEALTKLVNHSIDGGINYLVVLGTTAESATLTPDEKQAVISHIRSVNAGRLPLVLGIGGNNTQEVIQAIANADLEGYDAILSVSPYYNKPTQEGIYQHYKAIATSTKHSIILYNVPGRTSSNMLPETTLRLGRDFENIIGVKEAAGDMAQVLSLLMNKPKDFLVISGDDMLALPLVSAGGAGVISVLAQGPARLFSTMIEDGLQNASYKAYNQHFQLMPLIDYIFEEGNPAGIKLVLHKLGICEPFVRLPLVVGSAVLKNKIGQYVDGL